MPMIADRSSRRSASAASASQRLRTNFAAARVSFTWFGVRKTLSAEQRAQAAEPFGAEQAFLSAGKKILDTSDEKFQAVTSIRHKIQSYWRNMSLPYPEPGVRLIKQQDIEGFDRQLHDFKAELATAVEQLDQHFTALKAAAQQQLGGLYNPADYPASLTGLFDVTWDFPSVEPPEYLLRLSPQLFAAERERINRRFDQACEMATSAFVGELARLVDHLVERLGSEADGTRRVFRDTAVSNLREFFDRFKSLNVHSSVDLDRLVETAQRAIAGVEPQAVRDNDSLRQHVATQLSSVAASLDQMLIEQPRRRILRPGREGA